MPAHDYSIFNEVWFWVSPLIAAIVVVAIFNKFRKKG